MRLSGGTSEPASKTGSIPKTWSGFTLRLLRWWTSKTVSRNRLRKTIEPGNRSDITTNTSVQKPHNGVAKDWLITCLSNQIPKEKGCAEKLIPFLSRKTASDQPFIGTQGHLFKGVLIDSSAVFASSTASGAFCIIRRLKFDTNLNKNNTAHKTCSDSEYDIAARVSEAFRSRSF